jgi:hypothetical protein
VRAPACSQKQRTRKKKPAHSAQDDGAFRLMRGARPGKPGRPTAGASSRTPHESVYIVKLSGVARFFSWRGLCARRMANFAPSICAGHDVSCPYEETAETREGLPLGGPAFCAKTKARDASRTTMRKAKSPPGWRRYKSCEADGEQVAKHVRRAQHAMPLRRNGQGERGSDAGGETAARMAAVQELRGGWRTSSQACAPGTMYRAPAKKKANAKEKANAKKKANATGAALRAESRANLRWSGRRWGRGG